MDRVAGVVSGAGEAVVGLPHYFAKINKTPSYQLTPVGAPMPTLHVAAEIDEAALSAGVDSIPASRRTAFRLSGDDWRRIENDALSFPSPAL